MMSAPAPVQTASDARPVQVKYNMKFEVVIEGKTHRVELARGDGHWHCRLDGEEMKIDAVLPRRDVLSVIIGKDSYEVKRERTPTDLHLWIKGARYAAEVRDPRSLRSRKAGAAGAAGPQKVTAPMPGKIVRINVKAGEEVEVGQGVVVVEAMKMQNEMKASKKGVVKQVLVKEGASVTAGEVLAIIE
jgi:biotin carboxyl carrier protein